MDTPSKPVAFAYFDAQNLFKSLRDAWGVKYTEYDPRKLAAAIADKRSWVLKEVYFYTGVPDGIHRRRLANFWGNKLPALKTDGVHVYATRLSYDSHTVECPKCHGRDVRCDRCGPLEFVETPREKGIDVRLALDLVSHAQQSLYDAAIVFSQDQDFQEAVRDAKNITIRQEREVKFVSAFPAGVTAFKPIVYCSPEIFSRSLYEDCIDPDRYGFPEAD
jgi:hypothetical protein